MPASNLDTAAYLLKKLYTDRKVADLATRDRECFAMMRKEGGFTGEEYRYAMRHGNPQGVSGKFATAKKNRSESKGKQPAAKRRPKFGYITLDGEAMAATEGNRGAFARLFTQEADGIIDELGDSFAFDLFRDGTGVRGQIESIDDDEITLSEVDDARNFKLGMVIQASSNSDGSSPRTGTTEVVKVDEDSGVIEVDDASDITDLAADDYLFREDDPGNCMEGFASHIPLTAPGSSDDFRGMNRSKDPRRLAGVRLDDPATSIEENAGRVAVKIKQTGKKADRLKLNPQRFWEVARRLNAKVEYQGGGGTADYAFEYFNIHTPAGTLKAYADAFCPMDRGYVMRWDTWYLKHLYALPHIIQDDGRPSLRLSDDDGIEARSRGWVNLICTEPAANGVFSIG